MVQPVKKENRTLIRAGIHAGEIGVTMMELMVVIVLTVIFMGLAFAAVMEINQTWTEMVDEIAAEKQARDVMAEISKSLRSIQKGSTLVVVSGSRHVEGLNMAVTNDRIEFKSQALGDEEVLDCQYYLALEEGESLGLKSRGAIISDRAVGLDFDFYKDGKWEESWKSEGLPETIRVRLFMEANNKYWGRETRVSLPVAN